MKFDKSTLIALAICAVVLFGWEPFCRKVGWMPPKEQSTVQTPAKAPAAAPAPSADALAAPAAGQSASGAIGKEGKKVSGVVDHAADAVEKVADAVKKVAEAKLPSHPPVTLENGFCRWTLDANNGGVTEQVFLHCLAADRKSDVKIDNAPLLAMLSDASVSPVALRLNPDPAWKVVAVRPEKVSDRKFVLERTFEVSGRNFTVTESWELAGDYRLKNRIIFRNPGRDPLTLGKFSVSGGNLAGWVTMSGDRIRSDAQKLDFEPYGGSPEDVSADSKKYFQSENQKVSFAGVSNKYFCSILASPSGFAMLPGRVKYSQGKKEAFVLSASAGYAGGTIAPGGEMLVDLDFYSGPKNMAQLEKFHPSVTRTMHLAWGPLDYLARLLLWVLVKLQGLCGSYGWSIIILTAIVRLIFWPITARANESMKRMQKLQPLVKELREKYKDNPQLLNTKTMELYRKEKVNPVGGCLPILLQIPVFFALYATLDGAVALRQVGFWWAHDLAAPDTVAVIPLGFMDLPVNPLVLAMTGLMLLQQKLTPSTMDPMQQKMMMIMPLAMLFFLYDLPSGLTLYWTVSSVFSILQMLWQRRSNRKEA